MQRVLKLNLLFLVILGFSVCPVKAQKLVQAYLIYHPTKGQSFVLAMFSDPLTAAPAKEKVALFSRKAGTSNNHPLTVTDVDFVGGSTQRIDIEFDPAKPPDPDDTEIQITFTDLTFANGKQSITGTGLIYTPTNLAKLKEKTTQQQKDAAAKATATDEKKIFAGFSAAAPAQGSGAGNGEANFTQWMTRNFFASVNIKKSSAEKADPKLFNLSLTYRKVLLFHSKSLDNFLQAQSDFSQELGNASKEAALQQSLNNLRGNTLLGLLIDASGRLEGEALNFNVTNAVFDLPLYITSRTKNFGTNGSGYFKFRILPAGVELGRNLHSENDKMEKYYIGRFKFGGELSAVYAPADQENAFPKRIELTLQAVDRYLWRNETAFDQETKKAAGISRGHKPWYQADLKVYLGESNQGRFGFRVSRIRGMLPPTFSDTRAYTFGAIFESADDKKQ